MDPTALDAELSFVLVRPSNPASIGTEVQRMVNWAKTLAGFPAARDRFEEQVREGFAYNFDVEGTPSSPWQELAERTKQERKDLRESGASLVPGFTEDHPILQRTGVYRASWIDKEDPLALLEMEQPVPGNLFIYIGSKHKHVPILSGGALAPMEFAMATEGIEYSQTLMDEMGIIPTHPWAHIPPRPVHELADVFEALLEELGEGFGMAFAKQVSTPIRAPG